MTNAIVLARIRALYAAGAIGEAAMAVYVSRGILTQAEANTIMEVK